MLVDFFGTWCAPFQALMPILKAVKKELGDEIKIVKWGIDNNQELATKHQVRSLPSMILFKEGKQSGVLQKKWYYKCI